MSDQAISPLRRRMIQDMATRKLAPKAQHDYVQRVKDFGLASANLHMHGLMHRSKERRF